MKYWVVGVLIVTVAGCGNEFATAPAQSSSSGLELPLEPVPDVPEPLPEPQPEKPLAFCSNLDFENVTWSESLNYQQRNALALALNLSGSFEGSSGWSNLANNFDGQGMSFGLLNQTLGTGSLQPLLLKFSIQHPALGQQVFGSSNWNKLLEMLKTWSQNLNPTEFLFSNLVTPEKVYVGPNKNGDKYYAVDKSGLQLMMTRNQRSVSWAVENLYVDSGRTFKSDWKQSMKALGVLPEYISLQVAAAERLHKQALDDFEELEFDQIRAYLFLFDIVVQNGGLRNSHIKEYMKFRESNPRASEEELLLQLLEIRVLSSLPQWRDDVRRRKKAIILGEGVVHGAFRRPPVEYCYNSNMPWGQFEPLE